MNLETVIAAILLLLSAVAAVSVGLFAWRQRIVWAQWFGFACFAIATWSVGYALELSVTTLVAKTIWAKFEYLGIVSVPVGWFLFAQNYGERPSWLSRKHIYALFAIPVLAWIMAATNEWHYRFWEVVTLTVRDGFVIFDATYSWGWYLFSAYAYGLLLWGSIVLFLALRNMATTYRWQLYILLFAPVLPWIANFLYITRLAPVPLDLAPFAFTISALVLGAGILRFRLFTLVPIARSTVVDTMEMAMLVLDADNMVVDMNPAAQHLFSMRAEIVLGQPVLTVLDQWEDIVQTYLNMAEARTSISLPIEGDVKHFALNITPIMRGQMLAGRLVMLQDVTLQKQTEDQIRQLNNHLEQRVLERTTALEASLQEKEVLLREVHHRVKNNLQVISSLLSLQADFSDDVMLQQALRESQTRVRSMSLIHERLYRSGNLAHIDFANYIEGLVNHLQSAYRSLARQVKTEVVAESVLMDVETAVPLGLVLNELISNAYKHAFDNGCAGHIQITLRSVSSDCLVLRVADSGSGLPANFNPGQTNSLGLTIVSALIKQIKGTLEWQNEQGAVFSIMFPYKHDSQ